MDISIIIVSWNVRDLLRRCVSSIFTQTKDIRFEVIVVDNNSSDDTASMVRAEFPNVRLIANSQNVGFARANNQGISVATGTHFLFLNPDTELLDNAPRVLFDLLQQRPGVAAAGPQLVYPDLTLQRTVKRNPELCDQLWILSKLFHFFKPACVSRYLAADFDYTGEQQVEQLMGACLAVRGDLMRHLGGWSEDYFIWWEDVDLCMRIQKMGYGILYVPSVRIVHHEGKSFAQQLSFQKQLRFTRGMRTYFKKYAPWWHYACVCAFTPFSLLLAGIVQLLRIAPRVQSKA